MSRSGLIVDIETCHPDAEIPEYQNEGDAGMDLKAVEKIGKARHAQWFRTGLKIKIPEGYVGLIFPRSSITKKPLELANSVGVIDSGYRGEIQVRFNERPWRETSVRKTNVSKASVASFSGVRDELYEVGDRVAQLIIMPYPHIVFNEVDDLENGSERGGNGFGSTGT